MYVVPYAKDYRSLQARPGGMPTAPQPRFKDSVRACNAKAEQNVQDEGTDEELTTDAVTIHLIRQSPRAAKRLVSVL